MSVRSNALCFGQGLSPDGVAGRVLVIPGGISVECSGSPLVSIPFAQLSVGSGGFESDHLVLKWKEESTERTVYLLDPEIIVSFRKAAPQDLSQQLDRTARAVRRFRLGKRLFVGSVIAAVLSSILAVWMGFDLVVDVAVHSIPVEWERQLGQASRQQFLAGRQVITEGPVVEALREITHRLTRRIRASPYEFDVVVVKDDPVNAFALPGGFMVVFSGLLSKAESPEEVAGVMGHEMSHVLNRHGLHRIVRNLGLRAIVTILVGDIEGIAGMAQRLGIEMATLTFGRAQELEADLGGLELLYEAKVDPQGLVSFFERLDGQDSGRIELFSSHPMSRDRADRLREKISARSPFPVVPFAIEWERVRTSLQSPQA